jgi:hypothetical protein
MSRAQSRSNQIALPGLALSQGWQPQAIGVDERELRYAEENLYEMDFCETSV